MVAEAVAAHLDQTRRRALFAEIKALGAQAWMTGTDDSLFKDFGDGAQFFTVDNARLSLTPAP